jgi:Domain of unknown function (DUF5710)
VVPADAVCDCPDRQWLDVAYEDRSDARDAGLDWDTESRAWYIPEGTDVDAAVLERFKYA